MGEPYNNNNNNNPFPVSYNHNPITPPPPRRSYIVSRTPQRISPQIPYSP